MVEDFLWDSGPGCESPALPQSQSCSTGSLNSLWCSWKQFDSTFCFASLEYRTGSSHGTLWWWRAAHDQQQYSKAQSVTRFFPAFRYPVLQPQLSVLGWQKWVWRVVGSDMLFHSPLFYSMDIWGFSSNCSGHSPLTSFSNKLLHPKNCFSLGVFFIFFNILHYSK